MLAQAAAGAPCWSRGVGQRGRRESSPAEAAAVNLRTQGLNVIESSPARLLAGRRESLPWPQHAPRERLSHPAFCERSDPGSPRRAAHRRGGQCRGLSEHPASSSLAHREGRRAPRCCKLTHLETRPQRWLQATALVHGSLVSLATRVLACQPGCSAFARPPLPAGLRRCRPT